MILMSRNKKRERMKKSGYIIYSDKIRKAFENFRKNVDKWIIIL